MKGTISLTKDIWTALNGDSYLTVTGHWIEETNTGSWTLEHALLGFVQLNTKHDGDTIGAAMFKVCDRLGILDRVSDMVTQLPSSDGLRLVILAVTMQPTMIQPLLVLQNYTRLRLARGLMFNNNASGLFITSTTT